MSAMLAGCSGSTPTVSVEQTAPPSSTGSSSVATTEPATDSSTTSSTPALKPGPLTWAKCTDPVATEPSLQCATLTAPLDYDKPAAKTISLALVRLPATEKRLGAVLFNPGGPGASGFEWVAGGGAAIVAQLGLSAFDLIGFDPRGVDRSGGVRCQTDAERDTYAYLDDTPDTPAAQALLDGEPQAFATACLAKYGDTLPLYSTVNTAKDMDLVRAALGDDQISFLGVSYGTYLGATYASLFPARVRSMALDSAYEPNGDSLEEQYTTTLVGFEHAFGDWAAWCKGNADCAFDAPDVGARWDALLASLDRSPVKAADGRFGNQAVLETATIASLYSKSSWPDLAAAAADAEKGNVKALFALADEYIGRNKDGTYNSLDESNPIISCASGINDQLPPDPQAMADKLRALAPRFGRTVKASDFIDRCALLMPAQKPATVSYAGKGPVVVVGGTNDPATPIRWAKKMVGELGSKAKLVTYTGEGHGQLLASHCVSSIEGALLTQLEVPTDGKVCAPDPVVERPSWWDTIPVPDGVSAVLASPELNRALGLSNTAEYSELRTSANDEKVTMAAYDAGLKTAGFAKKGSQVPLPGAQQSIYAASDGALLSIVAFGPTALASHDMAGVGDLVGAGKVLVIIFYTPS